MFFLYFATYLINIDNFGVCYQKLYKFIVIFLISQCHQSRSLERNRVIARQILEKKLDFMINGSESVLGQEIAKKKKRKSDYDRKRRAKEEAIKEIDSNGNKSE